MRRPPHGAAGTATAEHDRRRFLARLGVLAGLPALGAIGADAMAAPRPVQRPRRSPLRPEAERLLLWHPAPAEDAALLQQGLPIGNGRLGALVGSDPAHELLALSESSMWEGGRNDVLQADGQFPYDAKTFGSSTMLATLRVDLPAHRPDEVTGYRRALDLGNGLVRVQYTHAGVRHTREVFASHPDGVIVLRFTQHGGATLGGSIALAGTHGEATQADGHRLAFAGRLANGRRHAAQLGAVADGGSVRALGDRLVFAHCRALTVVVAAATDYLADASQDFRDAARDPLAVARGRVDAALALPVDALLFTHVADHRALFDTMAVDLGTSTAAQRAMDSWSRLQARARPGAAPDPELEALYLQFGRYLTIAGSRDGLPTHLQGLWLADNTPPWSGDYHSDINLQMNHWLPDRAGLGRLFEPLADYCLAQVGSWTELTQRLFNDPRNHFRNSSGRVDGWTVAISTNPFGGNGWWWHPAGSAWLCNSLWQHVEYTQDRAQAARILPLLRGACAFWQARLLTTSVAEPDGSRREVLVADADWSPEHGPVDAKGITYAQELVWDLFHNTRAACALLNAEPQHAATLAALQAKLYLPRISPTRGALEEWMTPDDLGEPQHRHLSPLVGLFPGDRINTDDSPKPLLDACAQLLRERGMESYGWACAWRALCWARLKQAEAAYQLLLINLRPSIGHSNGTAPNFFDIYSFGKEASAFQIDANFGTPTAMLEMLVSSRPGLIDLLPALPAAWARRGQVTGIGARGGFVVDLAWADGRATHVRIRSVGGLRTDLRAGGRRQTIDLQPGQALDVPLPLR